MSCGGCTHETDADVVAALPSDLGVVYERVKKQIKLPSTNSLLLTDGSCVTLA